LSDKEIKKQASSVDAANQLTQEHTLDIRVKHQDFKRIPGLPCQYGDCVKQTSENLAKFRPKRKEKRAKWASGSVVSG